MEGRKIYRGALLVVLLIALGLIGVFGFREMDQRVPDSIKILVNKTQNLNFSLPIQ